jgi:hypothetical protein
MRNGAGTSVLKRSGFVARWMLALTSASLFLVVWRGVAQQVPVRTVEQMSIPKDAPRLHPTPFQKEQGARRIWTAVLLATNTTQPQPLPPELRSVSGRLQRVFGYNQFEIVGRDDAPIEDGAERKLTPSRAFWIDLKARRASVKEARGGYLLNLRLYQNERPLVDTVALIAPESPLFFRGPMSAKGQILIVLQVQ